MTVRVIPWIALLAALALPATALCQNAGGSSTAAKLKAMEKRLQEQEKEIQDLKAKIDAQAKKQDRVQASIDRYLAKDDQGGWFQEPNTFRAFFKDGLHFETSDKNFAAAVGGRLLDDWDFSRSDRSVERAYGSFGDETQFRQAWLHVGGTMYENLAYMFQVSLAGARVIPRFMWIGLTHLPVVGRIRIGNFKEPFGLEKLTSFKYITFLERGLPDVFTPGFRVGVDAGNTVMNGKLTWAIGLFHPTSATGSGRTGKNVTARIAYAPILADEGRHVLHFGFAYSRRYPKMEEFSQHPEVHTAPDTMDTGSFPVESENRFGFESALVWGPFSAQGEYMLVTTHSPEANDPTLSGYYVFLSYFVTGEHRQYKAGAFGRVRPNTNFVPGGGGTGAVELAAGFSHLVFDSGNLYERTVVGESGRKTVDVPGGRETNWTFAVNWYLNPNARVMLDYVLGHLSGIGSLRSILMRFQVDF